MKERRELRESWSDRVDPGREGTIDPIREWGSSKISKRFAKFFLEKHGYSLVGFRLAQILGLI